jgi:hypothetical protein
VVESPYAVLLVSHKSTQLGAVRHPPAYTNALSICFNGAYSYDSQR